MSRKWCLNIVWLINLLILFLVGSAQAATHSVTTAGELTTAMAAAVAGDQIVLADGTYTGTFTTGNAGTGGSKITLKALNRHGAIVANALGCSTQIGLNILDNHWTVQDLIFRNHHHAVRVGTSGTAVTGVTFQNNIIDNFGVAGIFLQDASTNTITENVIAHGSACNAGLEDPGIWLWNSDSNTITKNLVYGTGNNGHQAGSTKNGYGIHIQNNSDDNVVQGNYLFANGGKGVLRFLAASGQTADRNIARDNVFLWGEGGPASDDCGDDSNTFTNNFFKGIYWSPWFGKGNSDGTKGNHILSKNTFIIDQFTRQAVSLASSSCGGPIDVKIDQVVKDNVFYSDDTMTGVHFLLWREGGTENQQIATSINNLFYAPGLDSTWVIGYTYDATDIHSTQPTFVNAATGNYALALGSAGKAAASDGADIGISYNSYLQESMMARLFALPTTENTGLTGATSTSFAVATGNYYQVYFYIPSSGICAQAAEQFTVEGTAGADLVRDITTLTTGTSWVNGTARYITLGRHIAADGTLNVSWQHTGCVEKVFIRKLPTAAEAYLWLANVGPPSRRLSSVTDLNGQVATIAPGIASVSLGWTDPNTTVDQSEDGTVVNREIAGTFQQVGSVGPNVTQFSESFSASAGSEQCYNVRPFYNDGLLGADPSNEWCGIVPPCKQKGNSKNCR
jgi:parallel beta-helix repeat protein